MQRRRYDLGRLLRAVNRLAAPTGSHFPDAADPMIPDTLAPQRHRVAVDAPLSRNPFVLPALGCLQNNARSQSNLLRR